MKVLLVFAVANFLACMPVCAAVQVNPNDLVTASANSNNINATNLSPTDEAQLGALEEKFFAHTDARRSAGERVQNIESLVYGRSQAGPIHNRIEALISCTGTPAPVPALSRLASPVRHYEPNDPSLTGGRSTTPYVMLNLPPYRASVQHNITVVDRIESIELDVFGKKSCAKPLQWRVARLEHSILGDGSQRPDDQTITLRVNRLWRIVKGNASYAVDFPRS